MIDAVFDPCVYSLLILADGLGMSYEAVIVWIFCLIWSAVTLALVAFVPEIVERMARKYVKPQLVYADFLQMLRAVALDFLAREAEGAALIKKVLAEASTKGRRERNAKK